MQTRSGKTYANNSSSSKKKNNIRINMKVDNVNNRMILRSQTRIGKTNNSGNTYTATATSSSTSSREKNNIKLEIKVEKVEKVVNRTREPRPTSTPTPRPIPISTNRVPLGFVTPQKISNELAEFLGKPFGTEMLRTEVARIINTYIRDHQLQDPQNGKVINPDTKLRALLKLGVNDELTYFNISRYIGSHFIKSDNVVNSKPIGSEPSVFMKPSKISNELAEFLGKPIGTEISRTDVSSIINRYIRINKLQDAQNGRKINPDAKLRSILTLGENDELTYFNLGRYIKHHFIKEN